MYRVDILVEGYPGKAVCHGGLGWSTIALLRVENRVALVDCGSYGMRAPLAKQLQTHGVKPADVTDLLLTHSHHDHAVNWLLFPKARVWIGQHELNWATAGEPGFNPIAELHMRELARSPRLNYVEPGKEILPGTTGIAAPGHTPGHILYKLDDGERTTIFTGDSAKNRAELLTRNADASEDFAASTVTINRIMELWAHRKGTVLVPGHDLSMMLDERASPVYCGTRKAGIAAWFSETLEDTSIIDLTENARR